ncbi:ABC transporter substrate-binding protein [Anaerocolumna cellulosilytica]|uniref:ABC transporter substrate-binding protein n=1 Tax=Anaerocolumna cellulosilytica TaxID=433286 RepID=A0A6S6RAF3_9FIRM|nr:extracellular solute-binding protein [Anaerocolumna cellulosilytica]MBB5195386.1 putative aldouronate transport system substrate-binding protein [Anaerocolumna cellulosilytica]BCJ95918.1 ABC transporter substrate-binding protein [Anaerocolumna cellulosilytica]
MMKKSFKKVLALVMVLIMALSAAGCSRNETKQTKSSGDSAATKAPEDKTETGSDEVSETGEALPGWQQNAEDKVDLTWYINFSWFTTPWGENLVSKTISEETGVNIKFIVPAGNEAEKLNSLIASDSLPDLVTLGWYEPQVGDIIEDGLVYPLDELAEQYDPYWFKVADDGRIGWFTQKDGHIYGYPNSSFSPSDYEKYDNISSNQTFLVRKDIYEAIGSPDMTTPEGFKAAVKAAKEQFPEVNGQPLIPIGAHEFATNGNNSFDNYLCNFLAVPYEKNGEFNDRFTDPELVRWLKTFRELGEEGYLADDIFIDKRAQMEEKIAQGRYFCMLYQRTDLQSQQKILYANDPNSIYMAVDGPKNSKGDAYTLPGTGINGWTLTMISKNCDRPDRAIQLFSYLMSEHGQHMTWLGVEGVTWDYVDGVETMKPEIKELLTTDRTEYDKLYGADSAYWMFQDNAMALKWAVETPNPLGQMERWTYPYIITTSPYEITLEAGSKEADIQSKVDNEWGVVLPKLLLADNEAEFDTIWAEFMQKRKDWGIDNVLETKTNLMNEAKQKLGIK